MRTWVRAHACASPRGAPVEVRGRVNLNEGAAFGGPERAKSAGPHDEAEASVRQLSVKNTEPKTPVPSKEPASLPSKESPVTSAMAPEFAPEDLRPWARKGADFKRASTQRGYEHATETGDASETETGDMSKRGSGESGRPENRDSRVSGKSVARPAPPFSPRNKSQGSEK